MLLARRASEGGKAVPRLPFGLVSNTPILAERRTNAKPQPSLSLRLATPGAASPNPIPRTGLEPARLVTSLPRRRRIGITGARAGIYVAHHVQVVVVDIDDFLAVLIHGGVGHGPADVSDLDKVDGAFEVDVVDLYGADQRHHAGRIDAVLDELADDADLVPLFLMAKRNSALNGPGLLQPPHDLVFRGRVKGNFRRPGLEGTEDRRAIVTLVVPEGVFFLLLEVGRNWDRIPQSAYVGSRMTGPQPVDDKITLANRMPARMNTDFLPIGGSSPES